MKKTKKIVLACLTSLFLAASAGGAVSLRLNAEAATEKTGFYVEDGAAVRLRSEHEKFGIKFSAQVGEQVEGAVYNILIAPLQLVQLYEKDTSENKADIITYLQAYAESKGGKLSIVENCEVKNGKIEGAIVNVLWQNINRKFVGIAYYEKDGKITVAQSADDRERSIVDVSQYALDSGNFTSTNDLKVLFEKVRYGEMVENGAKQEDKASKAYQYERFYGTKVSGNTVTTAVGTSISLSGLSGSVKNNALQLTSDGSGASGATIDFGTIPAGTYRVSLAHTLVNGEFSSTITQNQTKTLATVWEMKELGNDVYEFYFNQENDGQAKFTISADTKTTGTVTIDNIALQPVTVEELAYSREDYMFGIGGLAKNINGGEGNWCDPRVTSDWMTLAVGNLGVESQRVWLNVAKLIDRAENSNELSMDMSLANEFHNHFKRLQAAGVKRITVMLSRYIYPYGYDNDATQCVPDPNNEASDYKAWIEMQYRAFKMLAKEFPEITLWECGNEYDLDTYMYKNGLKSKESWELTRNYCFTNSEKAYITADICYAANKAFKLYNPENQIVMPGMSKYAADKTNDHISLSASQKKYFFEEFYNHIESGKLPTLETKAVTDPDKYFDIIAYHAYASSVEAFETYNDTLMATAAAHGDGDKRIWITEFGYTENAWGGRGTAEAQEAIANNMGEILTCLEQEKYAKLIETVHFFRLSDTEGLSAESASECCYGVYHSPDAKENTSVAKPVAAVLYNYFNNATATAEDLTFWKGAFKQEDFEAAAIPDTNIPNLGANVVFYYTSGEIVEYNNSKALKVTALENVNENGYCYVQFAMGAVEKGRYEFALDAVTENGYKAIVQFRALSGGVIQESINNYKTLFNLAKKDGNRYVLTLNISQDYDDFGIVLAMSGDNAGASIILDNVSFTKSVSEQAIDFEDGVVQKVAAKGDTSATISAGYVQTHISTDGNGAINLPNEIVTDENGNKYFTVNYKGWSSWSAFNLGYFKAGSYTVAMDVKLISGTTNGYFIQYVNGSLVALSNTDYVKDGDTYLFKFTLTEDVANFGIGYQCIEKQNADFVLGYDNIIVHKNSSSNVEVLDNETFDGISIVEQGAHLGGVYATAGKYATELVADANGGKKLQFTKTATGYAVIALSVGTLKAGTYTLSMDVDYDLYQAIMQLGSLSYSNGAWSCTIVKESFNSYATLFTLSHVSGNTYSFTFTLESDTENLAVLLADSSNNVGAWIAIDNVKLKKVASASVGTMSAGNYQLSMDVSGAAAETAKIQVVTLTQVGEVTKMQTIQTLPVSLAEWNKNGNTYTLRFALINAYENVAFVLVTDAASETLTIENVNLTANNSIQTIDFENGNVVKWADKHLSAVILKDTATTQISTDGKVINLPNEIVTDENGNKYFTINYKGWGSWSAFDLGYLKAGSYTITMDVKLVSGTINGHFIKFVGNQLVELTEGVDYTVDGDTYTFKFTLEEDVANFGIGYQSVAGQNANFVLGYDNITVTVGANADGGTGDNYDWIDKVIH